LHKGLLEVEQLRRHKHRLKTVISAGVEFPV